MRRLSLCLLAFGVLAGVGLLRWTPASGAFDKQVRLTKTDVNAPPERIFALIEDFHNWGAWSPHEKSDPAVQRIYSTPSTGKGAVYEWKGSDSIGAGRAQIVESDTPAKIVVDLDLTKPVNGHLTLTFGFERTGTMTKVDIATSGPFDVVTYVMRAFFNDSVLRISCAADGSPKAFCDIIMRGVAGRQ